ncbi:unnamed protein product, partial [Ectocarpus sp. 13 AM-2016]
MAPLLIRTGHTILKASTMKTCMLCDDAHLPLHHSLSCPGDFCLSRQCASIYWRPPRSMEALGATQTALVKREAAEGESKNISEAKKRVAENESSANMAEATYRAEAHVGVAMEDEKRAAADRDLAIKKAAYKAEVNHAEATAAVAFDIEKARQGQTVVREQTKQRAEEALVMLDVQGTEALTMQKQKEGVSKAMLIEEKNKAEAIRAKADAKAHEINQVGVAEASAILAKGEAESKVLELRGDSFQHFGNAAIVQSIVDRLPDIAREIAAPLAKTDKV